MVVITLVNLKLRCGDCGLTTAGNGRQCMQLTSLMSSMTTTWWGSTRDGGVSSVGNGGGDSFSPEGGGDGVTNNSANWAACMLAAEIRAMIEIAINSLIIYTTNNFCVLTNLRCKTNWLFFNLNREFGSIELRCAIWIDILWKTYSAEPCIHYPNDS
jgi:hypothetical protein